tara:strand:- start:217 stop:609 length:393 start_codon:yes stop_codon:yes gene_type:complete
VHGKKSWVKVMINKKTIGILLPFLLAGCQQSPRVIVDDYKVDSVKYQEDLRQCTFIASQINKAQKSATGAAGGAAAGAVLGAIVGNSSDAKRGAGLGALVGAAEGASEAEREISKVVKNCLRGRGYTVLN